MFWYRVTGFLSSVEFKESVTFETGHFLYKRCGCYILYGLGTDFWRNLFKNLNLWEKIFVEENILES